MILTMAQSSGATLPPATLAALHSAATNFEAQTLNALLRPIFDTVDSAHGLFGGGSGEEAWRPMLVDQLSRKIADHGGLGIAHSVFNALIAAQVAQGQQR
jgi:Rod binding domain-containing protein